ncbi:MAG: hypothetical protein E7L38_26500, partial [Klebsiella pneumoniae]|nr:hypothetical protein [Klebsiella pneumoniae]
IGLTHNDLQCFPLPLSAEGKTLYVSNSLDGGISAIDTATGKVISLDASRYTLKKSWALPANPNSLLLSADGQTLFVTVKQPFNKDHSTKGPDSVVRIDLNAQ